MPLRADYRAPFNQAGINQVPVTAKGVYGIFNSSIWIYVGKGEIRQRLQAHLDNDNPCITNSSPAGFIAELVSGDPSNREVQLILELKPKCNKKVG